MKNTTGQKQTFRLLREVINQETGEVVVSSKGYRQLKPNQSFSYSPKDRITKQYKPGLYVVRISVFDNTGVVLVSEGEIDFEIQ
jgi:ABC-type transporter Mla maintaining outer membrane lipid asymmetry ATPase subunit MlaF